MRALVLDRTGLAVRDVPVPTPAAGEVLLRVAACAVCQSDVHYIRDRQEGLGTFRQASASSGSAGGGGGGGEGGWQVLGHELSGTIVACGPGVAGLSAGTRATARPLASCGHCHACRRGLIRACPERSVVGFTRAGAFAEYVTLAASAVYALPHGVSFDAAALAEPLACAYNAVAAAGVQPGDHAVVFGPGPLGLFATRLLKLRGALVLVAGTRDERLAIARAFGADAVCNVRHEDLSEVIRERTDGIGADAAIEMVGTAEAQRAALGCVRLVGTVVLAGEPAPGVTVPLDTQRFFFGEQRLVASIGAGDAFPRVLRLMEEGLVDSTALVTHHVPLEAAPRAFALVEHRAEGALKVLVEP